MSFLGCQCYVLLTISITGDKTGVWRAMQMKFIGSWHIFNECRHIYAALLFGYLNDNCSIWNLQTGIY